VSILVPGFEVILFSDALAPIGQPGLGQLRFLLIHEIEQPGAQHFVYRVAEDIGQLLIGEYDAVIGIDHPDAFFGGFNDTAVLRLALL